MECHKASFRACYNCGMDEGIDKIALVVICGILAILSESSEFGVAGALASVILVCICALAKPAIRIIALTAFSICAVFSTDLAFFLPVAAYLSMHEHIWSVRLVWLLPLVICASQYRLATSLPPSTTAMVAILCAVASCLAIHSIRIASDMSGSLFAYDNLRERYLSLLQQMKQSSNTDATQEIQRIENECFAGLTERELAIVCLVAEGMDNRQIATRLFLSEGTVRNHISSILSKKELENRTQIAVMYYRGE